MSQRVAGPVRTQRLGVRRPLLHARILHARVRHVRLLHAVVPSLLALRRDQLHRARILLSSDPANVESMLDQRQVAPVRINALVVL